MSREPVALDSRLPWHQHPLHEGGNRDGQGSALRKRVLLSGGRSTG